MQLAGGRLYIGGSAHGMGADWREPTRIWQQQNYWQRAITVMPETRQHAV